MGEGLFAYLQKYVRFPFPPSKVKQQFVMSVLFDSMALRHVHRGGGPRPKKAFWGSLLEETTGKMQRRITLTMLPGARGTMRGRYVELRIYRG